MGGYFFNYYKHGIEKARIRQIFFSSKSPGDHDRELDSQQWIYLTLDLRYEDINLPQVRDRSIDHRSLYFQKHPQHFWHALYDILDMIIIGAFG